MANEMRELTDTDFEGSFFLFVCEPHDENGGKAEEKEDPHGSSLPLNQKKEAM